MPRQTGPITIIGTLHGITYYKRKGKYWKRKKSSMNRHMVKTLPSYKKLRNANARIIASSRLASRIYKLIPQSQKKGLKTWRRTLKLTRRYMGLHLKKQVVVFKVLRELDFFPMTIGLHPEYKGTQHSVKLRKTITGAITYTLITRQLPKTEKAPNPKTFTISYLRPIFKTQPKPVAKPQPKLAKINQLSQTKSPTPAAPTTANRHLTTANRQPPIPPPDG
jgi:hypothetical protein